MKKQIVLVPLATALAALSAASANANTPPTNAIERANTEAGAQIAADKIQPNTLYNVGNDLFGLLVTTAADGTIVAQHVSHYSHSSHSSHSSHRSHSSSRY